MFKVVNSCWTPSTLSYISGGLTLMHIQPQTQRDAMLCAGSKFGLLYCQRHSWKPCAVECLKPLIGDGTFLKLLET